MIKTLSIISLFVIMIAYPLISAELVWEQTYGGNKAEGAYFVSPAPSCKGFLIAGVSYSYPGGNTGIGLWVVKVDSSGKQLWSKSYAINGYYQHSYIHECADGKIVWFNTYQGDSTENYQDDVWMLVLNSQGDTLWTKRFGNLSTHEVMIASIQLDNGMFLVCGSKWTSNSTYSGFVMKIDSTGNMLMNHSYPISISAISISENDSYYSAGVKGGGFWLMKSNQSGDTLWTRSFQQALSCELSQIVTTKDGGCVIIGLKDGSSNNANLWMFKISSSGTLEWEKFYNSSVTASPRSVIPCGDKGFMVAGQQDRNNISEGKIWRFNQYGDTIWTMVINRGEYAGCYSLTEQDEGEYISLGMRYISGKDCDAWLFKIQDLSANISYYSPKNIYQSKFLISHSLAAYDLQGKLIYLPLSYGKYTNASSASGLKIIKFSNNKEDNHVKILIHR